MSAYFTNSLTPPAGLGLLASPSRQVPFRSGSAWLGRSQKDGLPSCRGGVVSAVQGHQLAHRRGGSLVAAPFESGAGMDAKTRDLALLAFLSLFCAVSAWAGDRDVFGSVNLCYRIRADQPGRSMPITPFLGDQKFDPETKRIMGVAFEMARAAVPRAPTQSLP